MGKPLLNQYRRIKAEHEDCILMFRLGGFFVMLEKDAYIASKVLGLKPICRNIGDGNVPACGVPVSSVKKHANALAEKGYVVAICNQVDGLSDDGIMNRVVIEVLRTGGDNIMPDFDEEGYAGFLRQAMQSVKTTYSCEICSDLATVDLAATSPKKAFELLCVWQKQLRGA